MKAEGKLIFGLTREWLSIRPPVNGHRSVLVWWDTLRDEEDVFFTGLVRGQVVNRIPQSNLMCRKVPMTRLLQRMKVRFPEYYNFFPESYILPRFYRDFIAARDQTGKKYIIKPDGGSLGKGIEIVEPDAQDPVRPEYLHVAQEYLESRLIEGFKFDLRLFVLISSIDPLEVYVYRDGLVRVCAEKYGTASPFAQLTNTAVNKKNTDVRIEHITRRISGVFREMETDEKITALWTKIHQLVALTVIAVFPYLKDGVNRRREVEPSFKCFQIFGFDVLLDPDLTPHLIEVNYRPSLSWDTSGECFLKRQMLIDACAIVLADTAPNPDVDSSRNDWEHYLKMQKRTDNFKQVEFENNGTVPLRDILHESEQLATTYDCAFGPSAKVPHMDLPNTPRITPPRIVSPMPCPVASPIQGIPPLSSQRITAARSPRTSARALPAVLPTPVIEAKPPAITPQRTNRPAPRDFAPKFSSTTGRSVARLTVPRHPTSEEAFLLRRRKADRDVKL
jgi:hypothetical protein